MDAFFLGTAVVILATVLLVLYRVVVGPAIVDRIVAANVVGTKTIAVIVLSGHVFGRVEFFVDIALVYALINFIGTLALSRYFERKGLHHDEEEA
jgi:multicomponent Na+:H+ antiporter subunit F